MLKQILRDMYIDPEILAGLDETQKQTLFCKMREEQIRRWRIWDQKYEQNLETIEQNKLNNSTSNKRTVSFRSGGDGEVWVWVMGEHPDDKTIEEILTDEAKREARELAEIETKELRKSYVAEFSEIIGDYDSDCSINKIENVELLDSPPKIDDMEIYCSVDELRDRLNKTNSLLSNQTTPKINSFTQSMYSSRISNYNLSSINGVKVDSLKDSAKPSQKVSAKIALWEKRVINEKTNEIYRRIQKKQQESVKEAEEAARNQEELWQEQEKKSKQAECQMRDIARRAREEHRKSMTSEQLNDFSNENNSPQLVNSSPPSSLDSNISRPPSQDAVVKWYRDEEFNKGCGMNADEGKPYQWFHGLVTRLDAEDLLLDEPRGTFLVRVSEKIWGYAISYKDTDRIKHYLVDTSSGTYQFLGENQLTHKSLSKLTGRVERFEIFDYNLIST